MRGDGIDLDLLDLPKALELYLTMQLLLLCDWYVLGWGTGIEVLQFCYIFGRSAFLGARANQLPSNSTLPTLYMLKCYKI